MPSESQMPQATARRTTDLVTSSRSQHVFLLRTCKCFRTNEKQTGLSTAGDKLTQAEGVEEERVSGSRRTWFSLVAQHAGASGAWGDHKSFANAVMGHASPQSLLCELLQRQDTRPEATKVDQDIISCDLGRPNTGRLCGISARSRTTWWPRGPSELPGLHSARHCKASCCPSMDTTLLETNFRFPCSLQCVFSTCPPLLGTSQSHTPRRHCHSSVSVTSPALGIQLPPQPHQPPHQRGTWS